MRTPSQLPIPDLEGRPINVEDFRANTPEKLELLDGYLFDTPEHAESRRQFLGLLLVNVGLLDAVRLVPEERWREALRRVYLRVSFAAFVMCSASVLACRSELKTPGPTGRACDEPASAALFRLNKRHPLDPGGKEGAFTLRIDGPSLRDGTATLCIEEDSVLVHREVWRTWWWWHGPGSREGVAGDSIVRAVASRFFDEAAFGRLAPVESRLGWVDNPGFDRRAAIAEGLKEREYWTSHGLLLGTPLSPSVSDSLRSAPVDSSLILALADSLEREHPTTFGFWLGDENGLTIAWWLGGKQFVTVQGLP